MNDNVDGGFSKMNILFVLAPSAIYSVIIHILQNSRNIMDFNNHNYCHKVFNSLAHT